MSAAIDPRLHSMSRDSRAISAFSLVVAVFTILLFASPQKLDRPWSGDEPHKVSETYFFRLALERRFDAPDWSQDAIARSNPQLGKLVYGLAILAAGEELPRNLSIQEELIASPGFTTSEATRLENLGRLRAVRRVSIVATAISSALLFLLVARAAGAVGALTAVLLFVGHYVVAYLATTAVYDSMLTAAVLATILAASLTSEARRSAGRVFLAILTGVAASCAFQLRFSGLIAWGAASLVITVSHGLRRQPSRAVCGITIVTMVTVCVSAVVNPYYWSRTEPGGAELFPVQLATRIGQQIEDLDFLLKGHSAAVHSWSERLGFEVKVLTSGVAGKALAAGALLCAAFVLRRRAPVRTSSILSACAALGLVLLVWLPVRWDRYLEPVIAAMAVATGVAVEWLLFGLPSPDKPETERGPSES